MHTVLETINLTNHFDNCVEVDITEAQHRLQDLMNLKWSAKIPFKPNYFHILVLNIVYLLNNM